MGATFTWHATQRLRERSVMTEEEIVEVIDNNKFIVVGCEGKKEYRQNILFYSLADGMHLVLVYDCHSKQVITILPTEYYAVISRELMDDALVLAGVEVKRRKVEEKEPIVKTILPKKIRIHAYMKSGKTMHIGSWPIVEDFKEVIGTKKFKDFVLKKTQDPIVSICTIIGRKGEPVSYGWEEYIHKW